MLLDDRLVYCKDCEYAGPVLNRHHGYKWWTLPLGILLACTGIVLIPMAIFIIYMGNRMYLACPQCGGENFITTEGQLTHGCDEIWVRAKDADDRAFKMNKLLLLAVVMALLAAAVGVYFYMSSQL